MGWGRSVGELVCQIGCLSPAGLLHHSPLLGWLVLLVQLVWQVLPVACWGWNMHSPRYSKDHSTEERSHPQHSCGRWGGTWCNRTLPKIAQVTEFWVPRWYIESIFMTRLVSTTWWGTTYFIFSLKKVLDIVFSVGEDGLVLTTVYPVVSGLPLKIVSTTFFISALKGRGRQKVHMLLRQSSVGLYLWPMSSRICMRNLPRPFLLTAGLRWIS